MKVQCLKEKINKFNLFPSCGSYLLELQLTSIDGVAAELEKKRKKNQRAKEQWPSQLKRKKELPWQ